MKLLLAIFDDSPFPTNNNTFTPFPFLWNTMGLDQECWMLLSEAGIDLDLVEAEIKKKPGKEGSYFLQITHSEGLIISNIRQQSRIGLTWK